MPCVQVAVNYRLKDLKIIINLHSSSTQPGRCFLKELGRGHCLKDEELKRKYPHVYFPYLWHSSYFIAFKRRITSLGSAEEKTKFPVTSTSAPNSTNRLAL